MKINQNTKFYTLLIITIVLFGLSFHFINTALMSNNWHKVKATVTNYAIKSKVKHNQNTRYNSRKDRKYRIELTYQYHFSDSLYTSSKISFGSGNTLESGFYNYQEALNWLQNSKYTKGKTIEVFVNPDKPVESVVIGGLTMMTFIPLIMGAVFAFGLFKLKKTTQK